MRNILLACLIIGTIPFAHAADCGMGVPSFTTDSYRLLTWVPNDVQAALKEKTYLEFAIREVATRASFAWDFPSNQDLRELLAVKEAALQQAIAKDRTPEDAKILNQHLLQVHRKLIRTIRWSVNACR